MVGELLLCAIWYPPHIQNQYSGLHKTWLVTICDEVVIELVSGTLAFPTEITIEIDNVLNTLTFPSGSVPNTKLSFRPTLIGNNRRLVALATVTPVGYINSAIVALFTNDSE